MKAIGSGGEKLSLSRSSSTSTSTGYATSAGYAINSGHAATTDYATSAGYAHDSGALGSIPVSNIDIGDGKVLAYNSSAHELEYVLPSSNKVFSFFIS